MLGGSFASASCCARATLLGQTRRLSEACVLGECPTSHGWDSNVGDPRERVVDAADDGTPRDVVLRNVCQVLGTSPGISEPSAFVVC